MRSFRHIVKVVFAVIACAIPAGAVAWTATARSVRPVHRVGGRVHRAWPHGGPAPRTALARWMARQVGPTPVRPCRRRVHGRVVRCRRPALPHRARLSPRALTLSRDQSSAQATTLLTSSLPTGASSLQLIRSYNIPTDDPSYTRLLNWSWTYDSAMAATAFQAAGYPSEAQQLLDQLAALQHTDGSIEFAFDVANGMAAPVYRAGTIAAVGLAGSTYDRYNHSTRYLAMEERAASYLLTLQGSTGLLRGGPDVSWSSTQHNLLAYLFLSRLSLELANDGQWSQAATYFTDATKLATGIEANLIVHSGSTAYFTQGLGDPTQALDTDALGIMYLESRSETTLAQQVLAYTQSAFAVSGRSIVKSSNPATYNMSYAASGPFSGFKPYLGGGAPDVLWTEGSAEVLLGAKDLGQADATLSQSLNAIANVTPGDAPLQADRTLSNDAYGVEYHVWPAAAAGAWLMLAQSGPAWIDVGGPS